MKIKYTKTTLSHLERIFKEAEYKVRYEKGQFKSGYCLIYQKKIIVINKFFDNKGRIESLLDILAEVKLSTEGFDEETNGLYNHYMNIIRYPEKLVA
ncbi:MAG: hypothetical protein HKO66_16950 [Saprospiraceae bacterium]|nr:hypothetical protein [Bacteroidia bacterium]NNE16332.1 hypothetical protein [Saprospiraceae bacterium]NNL93934.1 hypothetical protein [Saprospiraceae bacterium]